MKEIKIIRIKFENDNEVDIPISHISSFSLNGISYSYQSKNLKYQSFKIEKVLFASKLEISIYRNFNALIESKDGARISYSLFELIRNFKLISISLIKGKEAETYHISTSSNYEVNPIDDDRVIQLKIN